MARLEQENLEWMRRQAREEEGDERRRLEAEVAQHKVLRSASYVIVDSRAHSGAWCVLHFETSLAQESTRVTFDNLGTFT